MPTAVLYIRVSTDEQAQKGYSQRIQHEHLQKFCISNHIEILKIIYEDYSAKTFNRPAWSDLLKTLFHSKSNRPNQILFTRWDRFSRNIADAYYMIEKLRKINVQSIAIDQPLDLTIPENKIMLAIYLATSEVENDRRSLNVKQGIHKAKQEGRCTNRPPIGYKNITLIDGRKSITIIEPEATFVKNIFSTIAESGQSIHAIYCSAVSKGLKCSLNNFWLLIRNPFYCGKIVIPEYEQQNSYLVKGLHQALITEQVFDLVQRILDDKKKTPIIRTLFNPQFPLRGFIKCPLCTRILTGSASKGKSKYYHYYHCSNGCKYRIRADFLNLLFNNEIKKLIPGESYVLRFKTILQDVYHKKFGTANEDQSNIFKVIEQISERVIKAKELMLTGIIDKDDYKLIKTECEAKINKLGTDLKDAAFIISRANLIIANAIHNFSNLISVFESTDDLLKRQLIKLICENQIILHDKEFIQLFNKTARIIYGLKWSSLSDSTNLHNDISRAEHSLDEHSLDEHSIKRLMEHLAEIFI